MLKAFEERGFKKNPPKFFPKNLWFKGKLSPLKFRVDCLSKATVAKYNLKMSSLRFK